MSESISQRILDTLSSHYGKGIVIEIPKADTEKSSSFEWIDHLLENLPKMTHVTFVNHDEELVRSILGDSFKTLITNCSKDTVISLFTTSVPRPQENEKKEWDNFCNFLKSMKSDHKNFFMMFHLSTVDENIKERLVQFTEETTITPSVRFVTDEHFLDHQDLVNDLANLEIRCSLEVNPFFIQRRPGIALEEKGCCGEVMQACICQDGSVWACHHAAFGRNSSGYEHPCFEKCDKSSVLYLGDLNEKTLEEIDKERFCRHLIFLKILGPYFLLDILLNKYPQLLEQYILTTGTVSLQAMYLLRQTTSLVGKGTPSDILKTSFPERRFSDRMIDVNHIAKDHKTIYESFDQCSLCRLTQTLDLESILEQEADLQTLENSFYLWKHFVSVQYLRTSDIEKIENNNQSEEEKCLCP